MSSSRVRQGCGATMKRVDEVGEREGDLYSLGYGFHDTGMPGRFCLAAALPAPGLTICMLSRPVPCRPGVSRSRVTTCADTLTTPPGTAHSRDGYSKDHYVR